MCIIRFKKNEFLKKENHRKKDRGNGSLCPFCLFWESILRNRSPAKAHGEWVPVYAFDFLRRAGFFCKTSAVRLGR